MILVVGASGYIGQHLHSRFTADKIPVVGTYCKRKKTGLTCFDIEKHNIDLPGLQAEELTHIIISAASTTRVDLVGKQWDKSYAVDVIKMKDLLKTCKNNGIIPIYISSDFVFNGQKGNYSETDDTDPINHYGKIKACIESYIVKTFKKYLIIRTGKVFGTQLNDRTLISSIIKDLTEDKILHCSTDQFFTPVEINDLVDFIAYLLKNKTSGIFHVASTNLTTRFELACQIKDFFRLSSGKIKRCRINELGLPEPRPLKIDLNISKYMKLTGQSPKTIKTYLEKIKNDAPK